MAKFNAVWGIDIGQCALKALRVRAGDDPDSITADAFDYIEYPQILSQPEANPVELVREALEQFLSRNSVRGDRVVISVSGQSGLARFIKLPPIEAKKIPDIIKYEARQQIPFALDDVVWDYQRMPGGSEEDGILLESEIGLFAMKRDQVFRALRPFEEAGIEVDMIQLTPLAIYNYTVFDQMIDLPPADEYDPDNPPESVVVLSLGTDTTDLVITNGYRVWQRSVPLGGSHFTKALSKELRLTFAKAEHLKRNAMQAEDRGAVFQAMRPVFNDLLTEVQRSIGFFSNIGTSGAIGRVVALGNATKLPGLQKYLAQNLGYPVVEVEKLPRAERIGGRGLAGLQGKPAELRRLLRAGAARLGPLQAVDQSVAARNPHRSVDSRQETVGRGRGGGVAVGLYAEHPGILAGMELGLSDQLCHRTRPGRRGGKGSQRVHRRLRRKRRPTFKQFDQMGQNIVGNVEGRMMWIEVLKALDASLPSDPPDEPAGDRDSRTRGTAHHGIGMRAQGRFGHLVSDRASADHRAAGGRRWRGPATPGAPVPGGPVPGARRRLHSATRRCTTCRSTARSRTTGSCTARRPWPRWCAGGGNRRTDGRRLGHPAQGISPSQRQSRRKRKAANICGTTLLEESRDRERSTCRCRKGMARRPS